VYHAAIEGSMIRLQHISKRFGPLTALDDVSLDIPPATVTGLLGENGAGKSTLVHILFGLTRPDAGSVMVGERAIRSARDAAALGVGMVHQHFKLVPTLTAMENFSLFLNRRATILRRALREWLERLQWTLPLEVPVGQMSIGQQQRTEIMKALLTIHDATDTGDSDERGVFPALILDEPTAVLTPQEASELFTAVRHVRDAGTAIIFISHKLDEVTRVCDRIAILRRGKLVFSGTADGLSADQIAEKMVGTRVEMPHLERDRQDAKSKTQEHPVLAMRNLSSGRLRSVSLELRPPRNPRHCRR
jgi:simple sugar transport system ATP-binding protein